MVSMEGEAFGDCFRSAGLCHVALDSLCYPSRLSSGFDLLACTHTGMQKVFPASTSMSLICSYLIFEEIMV